MTTRRRRRAIAATSFLLFILLLAGCSAASSAVTGPTTHATIQYTFNAQLDNTATNAAANPSPTPIDVTVVAHCPKAQMVLAGGFNLDGSAALADWQVALPWSPNVTPDTTSGSYHPVADLVRVVGSEPLPDLSGWSIHVVGNVVPSSNERPITAYAYCASGMSTPPTYVVQRAVTSLQSAKNFLTLSCPNGGLISGAGYLDGQFDDGSGRLGSKQPYMPTYSGFPEPNGSWVVSPDLNPMYRPYPDRVNYEGILVCVSPKDFALVTPSGGDHVLPFDTASATHAHLGDISIVGIVSIEYFAYAVEHHEPTTCPAGSFLLPPAFDFAQNLGHLDLRIDADFVQLGLDGWNVDLSTAGGLGFTAHDLFGSLGSSPTVFVRCLQPR